MTLKSPASARPSSLEELMAKSVPKSGTEVTQLEVAPKPKEEPQQKAEPAQQPTPAKEKGAGQPKPPLMMGKALDQSGPQPKAESQVPMIVKHQEESQEPPKEESREQQEKSREQPKKSRKTKGHESRQSQERRSSRAKEGRSGSSKRRDRSPELVEQSETGQTEVTSTAGESTTRGRPRLALMDKPRKAKPDV